MKVPEPTFCRLPWFLVYIKLLKSRDETAVSLTQIAKEIAVDASQVSKDLSFVNISGKTCAGYEIDALIDNLESADFIIRYGIKALWNFTPFRIIVPDNIIVQNTLIYIHLAVMFNRMK
jgi:NADH/NAD ratio-sensing transcriptional regulator Rex